MDAKQDNYVYDSRSCHLVEKQKLKLQDSQQKDKVLKEVCSWILNKYRPKPWQMINRASK